MRYYVGGLVLAAMAAAVACGGASGGTPAPEADLTLDDLPVKLPPYQAGVFTQTIDHGTDGIALIPAGAAAAGVTPAAPDGGAGADGDAGAPPTTFGQRYWYNPAFRRGPDSPVLFYFCGEAECSPYEGTSLADSARTLGAAIVVLEHRYYGASVPFGDPNVDQMKYLTIHNALEDAAAFEKFAIEKFNLQGKWISVGGSYPGMLAAFYRLKHPELVVGAWASSAPIGVVKSFPGYDALATRTLGPECSLLVRQAEARVDEIFADPEQKKALVERFYGVSNDDFVARIKPLTLKGWIMGEAKTSAQYGSSHDFCNSLAQHETDPLEGFFQYVSPDLADDPETDDGDGGVDVDGGAEAPPPRHLLPGGDLRPTGFPRFFDPDVDSVRPSDDDENANAAAAPRKISGWSYQVCAEVGFYQVHNSDRSQSIAPTDYDDAYFDRSCAKQFGLAPNIAATRATYFDPILHGAATNILFVNGTEDPWSNLGLTDPSLAPPGIEVLVVKGGSHCADLENLYPGMLAGIYEAHLRFNQLAKSWIAGQ